MARRKQKKIAEFLTLPNCFREAKEQKDKWKSWFGNEHPLTLEIGCGKGDLSLGLARLHPDQNFVGIDLLSSRMWTGAKAALEEGLKNVAFHRCIVEEITEFFGEAEVDELWITFPDPYPKKRHIVRRLTHKNCIELYRKILVPGGRVQFKTDANELFEWTLEHYQEIGIKVEGFTRDLHNSEFLNPDTGIITDYERRFLEMGKNINYMWFRL